MSGSNVYNSDDDPGAGGSHHQPAQPASGVYSSEQDPGVGGNAPADQQPGILNKAWKAISAGANELWTTAGGAIHSGDTPQNREAGNAGVVRGVRDFTDKLAQVGALTSPGSEGGFVPPNFDPLQAYTEQSQRNAADRAESEQKYGSNPSFHAGRLIGQTVATAPLVGPLGAIAQAGVRALPFVNTAARGLLGIGERALERAVPGAVAGGTQAALTSDPSQPFAPQALTGMATGAIVPVGLGMVGDTLSNALMRLRGGVVPQSPYTGGVPDVAVDRARNAQTLVNEGVPVQASQVSTDPVLQTVDKYGSRIPGSGAGDFTDNQWQAFRNRAVQRVEPGSPASTVTPDFVTRNDARIDGMYQNSVQAVPSVPAVGPSGLHIDREFGQIRQTIPQGLTSEARAQINGVMNDVSDAFRNGGGQITGSDAQLLTRRTNSALAPLLDSDNSMLRNYGMQIRDLVNQRLRSQMTPAQQATFDAANSQFRALRTLQNVADSNGSFEPGALFKETKDVADKFHSPGTLDDLARAGDSVIQPTLQGRSAAGPRVAGQVSPFGAAVITSGLVKPFVDWATTGGVGTAGAVAGMAANRGLQAMNRAGGQRAINATLSGGGQSVADLSRALDLLRAAAVSNQLQASQPPGQ